MKKIKKVFAGLILVIATLFIAPQAANADIVRPRISADGHAALWNCSGPYYNWSWRKYEYWCYYDYTWYSEVFLGKRDYWGYADAWYTA